jgi:myosin heavy subunit
MMSIVAFPLGDWLMTQAMTTEPNGSAVAWILAATNLAALLAVGWVVTRWQATRHRLDALTVEHKSTAEAHRDLLEKERKQAKDLDTKREEVGETKKELAAQRKKTHEAQEEAKKLREQNKALGEELQRARGSRPAVIPESSRRDAEKPRVEPPRAAVEPEKAKPTVETKPTVATEPTAEPEPVTPYRTSPARTPAPAEANDESLRRLHHLEEALRGQTAELEKEREAARLARVEVKSMQRRVESLRRVDLISTGKIEVLEDKLSHLGRQYYDVISELAALKGEVRPPPPAEERQSRRPPRPAAETVHDEPSPADEREALAALAEETPRDELGPDAAPARREPPESPPESHESA